jgi:EAL domain-containing protein (putative c-di-GMP-specific phosphodiesterase class I)
VRHREVQVAGVANFGHIIDLGPDFVKLDRVFPNEIAALQAIAVNYEVAPALPN